MSGKYTFNLTSQDPRRNLPPKIIIGQDETETVADVVLKAIGFVLFYRDRLQIQTRLPNEMITFVPDLSQLDYELRPILWVECGECTISKLHKLAVKAPDAEIWVLQPSLQAAEDTLRGMAREDLRRGRYH